LSVHRPNQTQSRAVFLTARGATALGWPRRKPPRAETQRRHELALAMLVARLESDTRSDPLRVLTERECRQAERAGGRRWSVDVVSNGGRERRWPDLVIDFGDRRRAVELELSVKHTARLERILAGYHGEGTFEEVLWLVESPPLRRRLERLLASTEALTPATVGAPPRVRARVAPFEVQRAE
jgi:hypothetical protein